jgi:tetratricopeptide (TPR) repeat protein
MVVDVERFGDPSRTNLDQLAIRGGLYDALRQVFRESRVDWGRCITEDRGDGALILVPSDVPKSLLVTRIPAALAAAIGRHNEGSTIQRRMRLRLALHAGEIHQDAYGVAGAAINHAFRLIEAPALKSALDRSPGVLAVIVSGWFFDEVVRHHPAAAPGVYRETQVTVKETETVAWIRVADDGAARTDDLAPAAVERGSPAGSTEVASAAEVHTSHALHEPADGPVALSVTVPLGRLPVEVRGRDSLLAELRASVTTRRLLRRHQVGVVWVLAGMGGLGKSTAALATAQVAVAKGWKAWWVTATDLASLQGCMVEVLRQLDAPEPVLRSVQEGSPVAADRAWQFLNGPHVAGSRWLLIFDNADDPAVLAAPGSATPADHAGWLRPGPSGVVIVTTRNKNPQTWGPWVAWRELSPLDEAAAAGVLTDLCPGMASPRSDQAIELGRRLGGLPLALHLAGSYLSSPFARWHSFADYRRALDEAGPSSVLADLDDPSGQARNTIWQTWDLSLDAMCANGRPQARPVMLLLSCYAPATPISLGLLQAALMADLLSEQPATTASGDADGSAEAQGLLERRLRDALRGLSDTGLINITSPDDRGRDPMVTVHPVVADVNRSKLLTTARSELARTGPVAVRLLAAAAGRASSARPADWPAWQGLFPHLAALLGWLSGYLDEASLTSLLDTSVEAADAVRSSGNPAAAEMLARACVAAAARLGPDHAASLTARQRLAHAVGDQGRNREAEALYGMLLADQERVLGGAHDSTFVTRRGLAWSIECQGRHVEAGQIYQELLSDQERTLGVKHADTLRTRSSVAWMLGLHGHYTEADRLVRQILADRQQILGDDHPETLTTRHALGYILWRQGRHDDAGQLFTQLLADRQRILGRHHPSALATSLRLARVLADQRKLPEADQLCRQVLADRQRILGDDHPATLTTRSVLMRINGLRGRYPEAEQTARQLLADQHRILGEDHPDELITRHNLADFIDKQGRQPEAEQLCRQVLADRQQILGEDHPDTLNTCSLLARILADQGRITEARDILSQLLTDRRRILGDHHPDTHATDRDLKQLLLSITDDTAPATSTTPEP